MPEFITSLDLRSFWGPVIRIVVLLAPALAHLGCVHLSVGEPLLGLGQVLEQKRHVSGTYHTVVGGEDIASIAKAHRVDAQQLAEVNNLRAPYRVDIGSRIFIPEASPGEAITQTDKDSPGNVNVADYKGKLAWPVEGTVVSEFGVRGDEQYNGIEIEAQEGTPIHAAADGRVGHVGSLPGYGNLVLIEHADRLVTVYAHMKDISVKQGDSVVRGAAIGTVGTSGRVEGPLLYFEVRSCSKPRNPLFFLERKE